MSRCARAAGREFSPLAFFVIDGCEQPITGRTQTERVRPWIAHQTVIRRVASLSAVVRHFGRAESPFVPFNLSDRGHCLKMYWSLPSDVSLARTFFSFPSKPNAHTVPRATALRRRVACEHLLAAILQPSTLEDQRRDGHPEPEACKHHQNTH